MHFCLVTEEKSSPFDISNVIHIYLDKLPFFLNYLVKDKTSDKLDTQYGQKIQKLGYHKLKILEWIYSLAILKNDRICKRFQELELPKSILELIKVYNMNTFLHSIISKIFIDSINIDTDLWVETVNSISY